MYHHIQFVCVCFCYYKNSGGLDYIAYLTIYAVVVVAVTVYTHFRRLLFATSVLINSVCFCVQRTPNIYITQVASFYIDYVVFY